MPTHCANTGSTSAGWTNSRKPSRMSGHCSVSDHGGVLAIIPARQGSKRLPGKNMLPLAGKPMIHWTIEAARASTAVSAILVSSDDPQILALAKELRVQYVL